MGDSPPPRKTRRSSILKGSSRAPLQNLEDNEGYDEDRTTITRTATFKRRVSFSSTNKVQEFCHEADEIWGERYEKPMLPEARTQSDPTNLQTSHSFQSLMTGEIKSAPSSLQVRNEIQFTYSESVMKVRASQPTAAATADDLDDEMELTSTNLPVFSQESQTSQAASQVTVIDCQAPVAIDKENFTHALNKTTMSTVNMSMDPGSSLTEDASYLNSPGFNKTHLTLNDEDDLQEADDLLDIFGPPKQNLLEKSAKPMNKTANESLFMDITSFGQADKLAHEEEEEEKTEDLAKLMSSRLNATCKTLLDMEEDNTNDILKDDVLQSGSSMDTEELVPTESISSLSKHCRSLSFSQTAPMDTSVAPTNVTCAAMEMTMGPSNASNTQMEMTMAAPSFAKELQASQQHTSVSMNKTLAQPLEMSFDEEPVFQGSQKFSQDLTQSQPHKHDITNYQVEDLSFEETQGNWNFATKSNANKSSLSPNRTQSKNLEDEPITPPRSLSDFENEPKPPASNLWEEKLTSPLMPEDSIVLDTTKASMLNKTFDVQSSRLPASSIMDSTNLSVPDETLSDSVFISGEVQCTNTEVNSKDNIETIRTVKTRMVDKIHDESFRTENTKIVDTPKGETSGDAVHYSQTEDIGDILVGETGHVSVNLRCVERSGMISPELLPSKQVNLSSDQELLLSPNNKATIVTRQSPDKGYQRPRSMMERQSVSLATSPICRNFNAPLDVPSLTLTKPTPPEEQVDSPETTVSFDKQLQKSRRHTVEHSPIKKVCYDSALKKACSSKELGKSESTVSQRNMSLGLLDFEESMKVTDDLNCSKKSEMDFSRRSEFDTSKMSISFLPKEFANQSQQAVGRNAFDEFEEMVSSKKSTKLDEISKKMDQILSWYKSRKEEREKATQRNEPENEAPAEEMEVEVQADVVDAPLTPIASKLKEMSRKTERCWRFVADEVYGMELSILNDTMKMVVSLDEEDTVKKISLTPIKPSVVEEFVHKIFMQGVSVPEMMTRCKTKNDVPSLLREMHSKLVKFTHLMLTVQKASSTSVLSYQGTRIHFRCYSMKLIVAIEVSVDFAKWDRITEEDIEVCTFVGTLECKEIPSLVAYERKNESFLPKYIKTIENLIRTKEKFA
ncbi:uncharacterized protein LOC132204915 [Neocloeon triangulifer]|uniref:uncharacterized protein LOC132204915 n=1 Tax=Neocloeon triangulifer TaxID=2078957 RepID=UPI00286F6441|nr:uncharacterized protein LOC132204915 [Neocloeon triangulifer]